MTGLCIFSCLPSPLPFHSRVEEYKQVHSPASIQTVAILAEKAEGAGGTMLCSLRQKHPPQKTQDESHPVSSHH